MDHATRPPIIINKQQTQGQAHEHRPNQKNTLEPNPISKGNPPCLISNSSNQIEMQYKSLHHWEQILLQTLATLDRQ